MAWAEVAASGAAATALGASNASADFIAASRRERVMRYARSFFSCSGMLCVRVTASRSAPRLINAEIADTRFAAAAHMSGVCENAASRTFTAAPLSSSASTVAASPLEAAKCSADAPPDDVAAFTFAPAASSAFTVSARPFCAARCNGV